MPFLFKEDLPGMDFQFMEYQQLNRIALGMWYGWIQKLPGVNCLKSIF
jgi:hypothetical protein